jgi:hypothetical protein
MTPEFATQRTDEEETEWSWEYFEIDSEQECKARIRVLVENNVLLRGIDLQQEE